MFDFETITPRHGKWHFQKFKNDIQWKLETGEIEQYQNNTVIRVDYLTLKKIYTVFTSSVLLLFFFKYAFHVDGGRSDHPLGLPQ